MKRLLRQIHSRLPWWVWPRRVKTRWLSRARILHSPSKYSYIRVHPNPGFEVRAMGCVLHYCRKHRWWFVLERGDLHISYCFPPQCPGWRIRKGH